MIFIKDKKSMLVKIWYMGLIFLVIIGTLLGCGNSKNEDIKAIVISFYGDPIESYSYKLIEEDNIKEAMRIYKKLKTYKSPKVSTWFEDVTYEIEKKDGSIEKTTFKKIRPLSDIFEKIFTSLEVRKQKEPILANDISEIAKIEMSSTKNGESVVYENQDDIEKLMRSLKEYYSSDAVISELKYPLVEMNLFNGMSKNIGGGYIYREDQQTRSVLDSQGNHNLLIVTPSDLTSMKLTQGATQIEITDLNTIQIVLDNYQGYHSSESIITVEYHLKETKSMRLDWHGSFLKDAVPKEIESLFK